MTRPKLSKISTTQETYPTSEFSNFHFGGSKTWATTTPDSSHPNSAISDDRARNIKGQNGADSTSKWNKLKKQPSYGAVSAARAAASSGHGKLHKRAGSSSSLTTTEFSALAYANSIFSTTATNLDLTPSHDPYQDFFSPPTLSTKEAVKVKVKPLLRRLGSSEQGIDLDRTVAENEGLGIYTSSTTMDQRDNYHRGYSSRGFHARTTSNTSQLSSGTMGSREPTGPYVHPRKQTPRPFTPPVHSYQNSRSSTDVSNEQRPVSRERARTPLGIEPFPDPRMLPSRTPPLPSRTTTSTSYLPTLGNSTNPTTHPGTPSSLRHQQTFPSSTYAPAPTHTARSSLESAFRKRSRSNTAATLDPAAQLAAVQALRAEFNAREEAKERKWAEQERRAKEKAERREREREARRQKQSDTSLAKENTVTKETPEVVYSQEYSARVAAQNSAAMHAQERKMAKKAPTAGSGAKAVSNQWSMFWWRWKTLLLKIKKSVGGKGEKAGPRPRVEARRG